MHVCNPALPAHFHPHPTAPLASRQVTTASVACGVLGVGGNKGAVAVEFSVHRRKIAVVCSHFAAHQVRVGGFVPCDLKCYLGWMHGCNALSQSHSLP